MEAVPRLHMLFFASKTSPEGTSFAGLKRYIAEFYQENPDNYSKELYALETLRNQALNTPTDNCAILKRYYCQLESLLNRFPKLRDKKVIFQFTWKDVYNNKVHEYNDIGYEQAAVLFNIAAAHTQAGALVNRTDVEGMKLACTHFQCAAWAFGEIRERFSDMEKFDDVFTTELLLFMQQVSLAQAQECILEKSLIDNRKPNIVAKVTAQIVVYYGAALAALLAGGKDGPVSQVVDSSFYKQWTKYVRFKISYLHSILYLYQGQHAEEQRKMGERVTLFEAAWEKLEEARKESKGLPDQKEVTETLVFTADVVEAKRKNAKNENEFIYHETVPELTTISAVQGANLVNGIGFSVTDPEVAGEDIFARLVPMQVHESSSLYSEEKAKLLRKYGAKIEEKDGELSSFMSSLTLDNLNINEEKANKIPQGIVDRCAALNANKAAIPDLVTSMSRLAEVCTDVEANLKEIGAILAQEDKEEKEFQQTVGVQRSPNAHITELAREFQKYTEAHNRAGESNDTLRKAMELHINNLKILSKSLQEIQQSVPKLSSELNTTEVFKDVKLIVNKVNEMKAQRSQFHADLRIAVNDDDITTKIIAHDNDDDLQGLFDRELAKHERLTQLIDQNLLAQENILKALTESYAKAAPVLKTLADVKHKRESFFASLAASYDVYEDLLAKSSKGLEFYNKLSANVQKLLSRCKSARDVQSEERQQRLKSVTSKPAPPSMPAESYSYNSSPAPSTSGTPKLRDYLKAKKEAKEKSAAMGAAGAFGQNAAPAFVPPVRPSPLGSETPSQAMCSGNAYYPNVAPGGNAMAPSVGPNEPPPPYSLQQTQYYDPNAAGYTNPIFYQYQQNVAPPAYKPQASPNSQFTALNANMAAMSMQQGSPQTMGSAGNAPNYNQSPYGGTANMPPNAGNRQSLMATGTNLASQNYANQPTMPGYNTSANTLNALPPNANPNMTINQQNMGTAAANSNLIPTANYMSPNAMQNNAYASAAAMNKNATPPPISVAPSGATSAAGAYAFTPNAMPTLQSYNQHLPAGNTPAPAPSNNIPPNQPLYVATNQGQSAAGIPSSLQAPLIINNQLQNMSNTAAQMQGYQTMANNLNATAVDLMQAKQQAGYAPPPNAMVPSPSMQTPAASYGQQTHTANLPKSSMSATPVAQIPPQPTPLAGGYNQQANIANQTNAANQTNLAPQPGFANQPTSVSSATTNASKPAMAPSSSTMHPGYSFNPLTGTYEYSSGYHQATPNNLPFYGQYTTGAQPMNSQVGTTDSVSSGQSNLSTGFDSPIVSHTKTSALNMAKTKAEAPPSQPNADTNYYNPPYGYQMTGVPGAPNQNPQMPPAPAAAAPAVNAPQQAGQNFYTQRQSSTTYMQSGTGTTASTQTTKSGNTYATSSQQTPLTPKHQASDVDKSSATAPPAAPKAAPAQAKKSSNIDLLTDIDFGMGGVVPPPMLPEPALKPVVISSPPASQVAEPEKPADEKSDIEVQEKQKQVEEYVNSVVATPQSPVIAHVSPIMPLNIPSPLESPAVRKASFDNLSVCSDLSSLDNFDWDSVSVRGNGDGKHLGSSDKHSSASTFQLKPFDPFADDKVLKYFHKEVERFEKTVESLNVKMLNGHTALSTKWKELQDLLAKDASQRSTTIAKLFPEKNRSVDCLPYDHARVKLDKETDDYINAAYIKNLGTGCPNLIIAQTPQQNTINDFWSMIWSQKARTVLCLHTTNEMLDPFWPQAVDKEAHFDDYTVKCTKLNHLSHCVEYQLNLSMLGSDAIIELAILQIKTWTKSTPSLVVGIARNAVQAHQQRCLNYNAANSPLIMNCLTGSERSELVAVGISAILATQTKRPVLINVVDVWLRICQQRQHALKDVDALEQSMQIVLIQAHDVLNKRGIMTSYQMKIAPQVNAQEKQAAKDPLNDLDALWKLK